MADGGMTIELDATLADRVRALAQASGATVEALVRDALADYVEDWSETMDRLAEYDRTGEFIDATEALQRFRDNVAARFRSKA